MINYLKDLRPEYREKVPSLIRRFYELHPNGNEVSCHRYVQSQILRQARKMIDDRTLKRVLVEYPMAVDRILLTHKSWQERGISPGYYGQIEDCIRSSVRVLDVGCGFNPLYVLSHYHNIREFFGIDVNPTVIDVISNVCQGFPWCTSHFKLSKISEVSCVWRERHYSLIFVQKLIPTLTYRNERDNLNAIRDLRCDYMLVTANTQSLSRLCSFFT